MSAQKRDLCVYSISCILLLFLLAGCGRKEEVSRAGQEAKLEVEDALPVAVAPVKIKKEIQYVETILGSLEAKDVVKVSSEIEGIVKSINFEEGDFVKKGDLLVELDDTDYRLEVERDEAILKKIQAVFENTQRLFERRRQLYEKGVVSKEVFTDFASELAKQEAELKEAKANLALSREKLSDTIIRAPISGIVSKKVIAIGEYVEENTLLLEIVDINPLKLRFTVPERYASLIKPHDEENSWIKFRVEAYPEKDFSAKIYFINPQVNPDTRRMEIKAWVDNSQGLLRPGFSARVRIVAKSHKNALIAPDQAIIPKEGKFIAYVVDKEKGIAMQREVEIGLRFEEGVEIIKGLTEGDLVVVRGNQDLSDGDRIRIVEEEG